MKSFPDAPGVYLMKDAKGVVIYIGKAKSLCKRIQSYLYPEKDQRPKIPFMVSQIHDVEYVPAESEVDALLMEARLVRDVQPKFNTELKDSKTFPYIEIRWRTDFPGVYFTRYCDRKASRYYGPFTDAKSLRQAIHLLQRIFKFRTCELDIRAGDEKRRYNRPCLLHYIDSCTAPCADRIGKEDYRKNLDMFCRFIEGKRSRILKQLDRLMKEASEAMAYEKAARYRDQTKAIESLSRRGEFGEFPEVAIGPIINPKDGLEEMQERLSLKDMPRTIEGVDIASISGREAVGSVVTFVDGIPFKPGYRRFKIKTVQAVDDYRMIREVVHRRYTRLRDEEETLPDVILIDGGKGHLRSAAAELKALGVPFPLLLALAKKEETLHVHGQEGPAHLPRRSGALRILQHVRDEAHRFAQHYHHILRKKRTFDST
ncbi:MAG: excinuclease ABC subunit UvrC [Planctomycetes bacterium]|nr:excinuclease ABC subunit UvrC [Planctomycetota bacterium]